MGAEANLKAKSITLPRPNQPVANYVGAVQAGNLLFVSGHGPLRDGKATVTGKVGKDLSTQQAYQVAREVGLTLLATVRAHLGSLDRVRRIVKVLGMVASAEGFGEQPQVINGFSDLILELYGPDRGRHSRSAVGLAELPFRIPVEIEAEVEIDGP